MAYPSKVGGLDVDLPAGRNVVRSRSEKAPHTGRNCDITGHGKEQRQSPVHASTTLLCLLENFVDSTHNPSSTHIFLPLLASKPPPLSIELA
jgi:hypothetical protein